MKRTEKVPKFWREGEKVIKVSWPEAWQTIIDFITKLGPTRMIGVTECCDFEGCHLVRVWFWDEEPDSEIKRLTDEVKHYKDLYEEFYNAHRERNQFP